MANVFASLPVPAAPGVGAWVDVSAMGPERTISVDGGAFDGSILLEGSNDAQVSSPPAAVGPFNGPTFAPKTFTQAWNFLRVRRVNGSGGTPSVTIAAPAAVANVFGALVVPASDGVGAALDISGGGDVNTFTCMGAFTGQILIETSTDGVNFSPTLLFEIGGTIGFTLNGVLSAARVRRRGPGTAGTPLVSVGSQATAGAAGGAFPGYAAAPPAIAAVSSAGASALVSRGDHTHQGALESGAYSPPAALQSTGVLFQTFALGVATFAIVALPTSFPGFGGAPPAVANASSAGAAGTASRSDHTHAGVASLNGGTGAATLTSTGGTIAITGAAPALNIEVIAGAFPGFGGAPPAVASASAAGAAGTASRSNHTHALDLVAYNPSLVGMQASGVVQQTYGAPTATPSVLTAAVGQVPFGLASGLLTTSASFTYSTTTGFRVGGVPYVNLASGAPTAATNGTTFRHQMTPPALARTTAALDAFLLDAVTVSITGSAGTLGQWSYARIAGATYNAVNATTGLLVTLEINGPIYGANMAAIAGSPVGFALLLNDNLAQGTANLGLSDGAIFARAMYGWSNGASDLQLGVQGTNNLNFTYGVAVDGSGGTTRAFMNGAGDWTINGIFAPSSTVVALQLDANGNVALGGASNVAASINGWPQMPSVAGRFTGVPTVLATSAPFGYDRTNRNLQIWNTVGATWDAFPSFSVTAGAGAGAWTTTNLPAGFGTTVRWWNFTAAGLNIVVPYFTNP